jgi:hypothetical protein
MRAVVTLVVLALTVAAASAVRIRSSSGILGRRQAYGYPMSDWAGLTVLGIGAGLAALVAGLRWLAWLLVLAVLVESFATLRSIRPKRRPR